MKIVVSKSFWPLFDRCDRYLILCGGRGSGKSEFAARKLFYRCVKERNHRFLVLRKVRKTAKESTVEVFRRVLVDNGIKFDYNKTERIVSFDGNEVLFDGLDEAEKIKSIKGLTGIWIEELTEFSRNDFLGIDLVLRESTGHYQQIICSFNPDEAIGGWIKEMFFDHVNPDACVHNSTIDDNPIAEVREAYRKRLDALAAMDSTYYKIYRLGEWALAKGQIFNWDIQPLPLNVSFDSVIGGGDFGYSVDPAAFLKIYRKADEYWLEEIIYATELTNQDLGGCIKADPRIDIDNLITYWDSAEPKSIEELCQVGLIAKSALKGPDSVRSGIDFLKSKRVHIVPGSENIIRECRKYRWREDKSGRPLPIPVEYDDHAMSAARYGIVTDAKEGMGDIDFIVL